MMNEVNTSYEHDSEGTCPCTATMESYVSMFWNKLTNIYLVLLCLTPSNHLNTNFAGFLKTEWAILELQYYNCSDRYDTCNHF